MFVYLSANYIKLISADKDNVIGLNSVSDEETHRRSFTFLPGGAPTGRP